MIWKLLSQVKIDPNEFNIPGAVDADKSINTVLQTVFVVAGSIAVLIITIAGLFYVISLGNPQATKKAKDTILYALIGLGVCVFAYTIVRFVIGQL
jgi:hypothetical protein